MSCPLIQPYLMFGGRCEEALEFYRTALGAQIDMLMRYQDSPEAPPPGVLITATRPAAGLVNTLPAPSM